MPNHWESKGRTGSSPQYHQWLSDDVKNPGSLCPSTLPSSESASLW